MRQKVIRLRLDEKIYKKFKIFCAKNDLSLPKQNEALIKKFVEIQEENEERLKKGS